MLPAGRWTGNLAAVQAAHDGTPPMQGRQTSGHHRSQESNRAEGSADEFTAAGANHAEAAGGGLVAAALVLRNLVRVMANLASCITDAMHCERTRAPRWLQPTKGPCSG